jgi:opacity protein-like surface antigen
MKRIWGISGVVLLALVLVLTPTGTAKADNQKGGYVGLFAGYVIPGDLEAESGGSSSDISLDSSYNLGIKAGYIFPQAPYLALELEYNYMFGQDVENQTVSGSTFTGEDVTTSALMANVLFMYPGDWFRPYIGFGIGWAMIDVKLAGSDSDGAFTLDESDNSWAWQFLLGVNFPFAKNWSADLGYRYFAAENFSISAGGSDTDIKYTNSTVILGINYHF